MIEDSSTIRQSVKEYLHGYLANDPTEELIFVEAETLTEGLLLAAKDGIDLVLLDLMLPDTNSPLDTIKSFTFSRRIPTIVLTALDTRELGHTALEWGIKDYVLKEDMERLGPLIFKLINEKEQRDAIEEMKVHIQRMELKLDALSCIKSADETVISK